MTRLTRRRSSDVRDRELRVTLTLGHVQLVYSPSSQLLGLLFPFALGLSCEVSAGAPGSGPCSSIPLAIPLDIPLRDSRDTAIGAIILDSAAFLI
jgi:hypothetical protein